MEVLFKLREGVDEEPEVLGSCREFKGAERLQKLGELPPVGAVGEEGEYLLSLAFFDEDVPLSAAHPVEEFIVGMLRGGLRGPVPDTFESHP